MFLFAADDHQVSLQFLTVLSTGNPAHLVCRENVESVFVLYLTLYRKKKRETHWSTLHITAGSVEQYNI